MAGEQDYDRTAGRGIQSEREPVQFMGSDVAPSIAGGAEYTFTYEPDYDMNPVGFRAPTQALAEAFAIVGMKIGPVSVMAGSGPFPLSAFTSDSSLRFALALPVTNKAPLKVTVRNMTTGGIAGLYLGVLGKVKRAQ
jgi:hypothetical protein